jgi:hypothetical protein
MSATEAAQARRVARELVDRYAPQEELSFDGVWADCVADPTVDLTQSIEVEGGSQLTVGGLELPLLSAIIIPVVLWVAQKVAEKAFDLSADALVARAGAVLRRNRRHAGGELSDEDVQRIARAIIEQLRAR